MEVASDEDTLHSHLFSAGIARGEIPSGVKLCFFLDGSFLRHVMREFEGTSLANLH